MVRDQPEHVPREAHSPLSLTGILSLAVWFGLTAGLGEVLLRGLLKFGFGQLLRTPLQFVWMAPAANIVLFTIVGTALLAASRMYCPLRSLRAILIVFSFLTLLAWTLLIPRLSPWAALLLSAGVALQLSSRVQRWTGAGSVMGMAAAVLLLALGVNGAIVLRERAALADLPEGRTDAPNVLFILWDTARSKSLSLYGHVQRTTPNLEQLANRGVTFAKAISTSPWTLPAHASMFTGRLPHETSAAWYSPLDDTHPTLAERLRDEGWVTGAFAANVLYVDWEHGLARGFTRFEDYRVTPGQIIVASSLGGRILRGGGGWTPGLLRNLLGHHNHFIGRKSADQVNSSFLSWLDERDGERPFFAFLNYFDAHLPYDPPAPFDTMFGPARRKTTFVERLERQIERRNSWNMSDEDLAAEVLAYEASIAYLDDRLGVLLESLDRRDRLDNTLIIVTSDHGEEFGEHGMFEHGSNLYFEQTHVPLVISLPGAVPEGLVIDEPVSIRDLAATVHDIVGADPASPFPGAPLARFWIGTSQTDTLPVFSELVPGRHPDDRMVSVLAEGFQYIRNPDDTIELYDIVRDWSEQNDLAGSTDATRVIASVRRAAETFTACTAFGCCCTLPPGLFPPAARTGPDSTASDHDPVPPAIRE
jgi:arylsulfatase A-like enzyme